MRAEFQRYGFDRLRVLIGALEICGGLGLLLGLEFPIVLRLAAGSLGLLMLVALIVRRKIKDSLAQASPAIFFLLLNFYILLDSFFRIQFST